MGDRSVMRHGNLLEALPEAGQPEEEVRELFAGGSARIERIVSNAHVSPPDLWYDQDEDEWALVIKGCAELEFDGGDRHEMAAGDWLCIPAHTRHRVTRTDEDGPTVWLAVRGLESQP
jgi:cupin 2 domain-containing protein